MAKMKKLLALFLVLSMCVSSFGMTAFAADSSADESISGPGNDSSLKPNATVTIKVEDITNANNEVVGETTTTQTDWSDTTTDTAPGTSDTEGNVTTTVDGSVTTDVVGSETSVDNTEYFGNGGVINSGSTNGSETTTTTDTTTTTTVTEDDVYSDVDEELTEEAKDKEFIGDETFSEPTKVGDDGWQQTGLTEGKYEKENGSPKETTSTSTSDIDVDEPDENINVDLTMNQGNDSETEVKTYIAIEDAMTLPAEGKQSDGSVVTYIKQNGVVIGYEKVLKTPDATRTETPSTDNVVEGTTSDATAVGSAVTTYVKPEGYAPGVNPVVKDGKEVGTETIEEILDENNNVIGYRITTVEEVSNVEVDDPNVEKPGEIEDEPDPVMPPKPVAPAPVTDENGLTTTVTVEDLIEDGKHVGYITTTKVTDEQGNVVSWYSDSIYHTVHNYSSSITEDPEREVKTKTTVKEVLGTVITQKYTNTTQGTLDVDSYQDVSQEIHQLVKTEDGKAYFLYQGKMYPVTAVVDGNNPHGSDKMTPVNSTIDEPTEGTTNTSTDLYHRKDGNYVNTDFSVYAYQWQGEYGLESAIRVDDNQSSAYNTWQPHQFILRDEAGNPYYVYCADFEVSPVSGHNYGMVNVSDADYYKTEDAANHIQAIAANGFWGTESGIGSLNAVKQMLKDALDAGKIKGITVEEIDALSEGEALTATQAAIWTYGDSGVSGINTSDPVGAYYKGDGKGFNYNYGSTTAEAASRKRVNVLYDYLVGLQITDTQAATPVLNENNFATSATLTIKEQVKENGSVVTDSNANKQYLTDLKLTIDVDKSKITGNLTLTVKQNGQIIESVQLTTEDSNWLGKMTADDKASSEYTFSNLRLYEGTKIDLCLEGVQNLGLGAYLYSSETKNGLTSQTFVGLSEGTRNVNLKASMEFTVSDPETQIQHTTNTWSEVKTDHYSYTRTNHLEGYKKGETITQNASMNTKVLGTTTKTDERTQVTEQKEAWGSEYLNVIPEVFVAFNLAHNVPRPLNNIPDEEVPLADAPQTGDEMIFVAVLTVLSGMGLAVMHLTRKKEEENV